MKPSFCFSLPYWVVWCSTVVLTWLMFQKDCDILYRFSYCHTTLAHKWDRSSSSFFLITLQMSRGRIILSFNENEINGLKLHCFSFVFFLLKMEFSWHTLLEIGQRYSEELKRRIKVCFTHLIFVSWIFISAHECSDGFGPLTPPP